MLTEGRGQNFVDVSKLDKKQYNQLLADPAPTTCGHLQTPYIGNDYHPRAPINSKHL